MNSPGRDPFIGRTLDGRYRVRARIARGGMGMVYLADDLRLGRKVAVKAMHSHLVDDESFVRRFEKEAHAAARLNDQNVVNVFDQGFDGEIPYLVMEYVPGITLRELLKQQKRLTAAQVLEISEAVLKGLAAAHRAGFIHRDLKPENVFLADDGRIKIGDFGLARAANNNTTTGQALLGTIAYLSPELVTRGVADARSDVYAFGIMLYEMLTGVQPFRGEQAVQVAYMHAHEDVPKPSLISKEATPELDELVRWTTARNPELRPKDAGIVLARLHQLLDGGLEAATKVMPAGAENPTTKLPNATAATTVLPASSAPVVAAGGRQVAGAALGSSVPAGTSNTDLTTAMTAETAHAVRSEKQEKELTTAWEPQTPIEKVQQAAENRQKRGLITALIVAVLTFAAGFTGWWFGQGPGSKVSVPDLVGLTVDEANSVLSADGFALNTATECTSPEIPVGAVVESDPAAGASVEPGSAVALCVSIGPAILELPQLIGLSQADAEAQIAAAGFQVGSVLAERFSDSPAGSVIGVFDPDGNQLSGSYQELGVVNMLLSAGPLPNVAGMTVDDASNALAAAGLKLDTSLNQEVHNSEAEKNTVLDLVVQNEAVNKGDSVGFVISLGPEMVSVPDLVGKRMSEAITELEALGLTPSTGVPAILRNAVRVSDTEPAAGEEVEKGGEVKLNFEP